MANPESSFSRDEQLAAVLASPPPRNLPPELRRAALAQSAPLSFAIFGAFFGGFGMLFVWIFFPWNFVQDLQLKKADVAQAPGRILANADTSLRIAQRRVIHYAFEFQTPAGVVVRGQCFTTGRRWIPGEVVTVRYRPENPNLACPVEARLSRSSLGMAFVIIFPLVGGAMFLWVVLARRRAIALLKNGNVVEARVADLEHTQTSINDYPVYKVMLQPTDSPATPAIHTRHWQPKVVSFLRARQQNKQPVFVLFNPQNPSELLLPESL